MDTSLSGGRPGSYRSRAGMLAFAHASRQAISQSLPAEAALERVLIRETPTCSSEQSRDGG